MDRNLPIILSTVSVISSLSARRAWIEINDSLDSILAGVSLSARRAWIEIDYYGRLCYEQLVALRKESVDRNH